MIERTKQRLNLTPDRLAADTAYGTGKLLGSSDGRRASSIAILAP
jgi:hypothetical protein